MLNKAYEQTGLGKMAKFGGLFNPANFGYGAMTHRHEIRVVRHM